MQTTVTVSDELVSGAAELTGRDETSILVRLGLEALIERESADGWRSSGALIAPQRVRPGNGSREGDPG